MRPRAHPGERREEVVAIAGQLLAEVGVRRGALEGARLVEGPRPRGVVVGVALARGLGEGLASHGELDARVLADAHVEREPAVAFSRMEERLVPEGRDAIDDGHRSVVASREDVLRGFNREPAGEERALGESALLVGREQVPRPVDRQSQRRTSAREHAILLLHSRDELARTEEASPRRGQLYRERYAIELPHERAQHRWIRPELSTHGGGTCREQSHGLAREHIGRCVVLPRADERGELDHHLSLDGETLARCGYDRQPRRYLAPAPHGLWRRSAHELLEVVEHEEHRPCCCELLGD